VNYGIVTIVDNALFLSAEVTSGDQLRTKGLFTIRC
jgi:hypothetical protein